LLILQSTISSDRRNPSGVLSLLLQQCRVTGSGMREVDLHPFCFLAFYCNSVSSLLKHHGKPCQVTIFLSTTPIFFFCIHALAGSNSFLDWVTSPFGIVAAYNYFGPFWVRLFIGKLSVCALQNGHFQN
jgi:hypothetical protein